MQAAVDSAAASMAGGISQGFLYSGKDQFSYGGGDHFVNTGSRLLRDAPLNLVEGILKILFQHGMNSVHHAVSLQTMRSSGRGGTHHVRQAAMGTADLVYNFIQRLLAAKLTGFQAQSWIRIGVRERT